MKEGEKLKAAIRDCVPVPMQTMQGIVKSVNTSKSTCVVEVEKTTYNDVMLRTITGTKGFILKPLKNSEVLIARINNSDRMYVAMMSDIESLCISNSRQSFSTLFCSLVDELMKAIITTPAGAGAFAPNTITKLTEIKTKFNQLFD